MTLNDLEDHSRCFKPFFNFYTSRNIALLTAYESESEHGLKISTAVSKIKDFPRPHTHRPTL